MFDFQNVNRPIYFIYFGFVKARSFLADVGIRSGSWKFKAKKIVEGKRLGR